MINGKTQGTNLQNEVRYAFMKPKGLAVLLRVVMLFCCYYTLIDPILYNSGNTIASVCGICLLIAY